MTTRWRSNAELHTPSYQIVLNLLSIVCGAFAIAAFTSKKINTSKGLIISMSKRKKKNKMAPKTMIRRFMTFPDGPWGDVNLAIFTSPDSPYIYVSRRDLGVHLKSPTMSLSEFQRIFRSCEIIKNSMWSKFMVVETDLPYPLDVAHKPAHQQEGWAGAHIYTLVTLGGLAAILGGKAGATNKLSTLFPSASAEYLAQCAQACLDKNNELTGQTLTMDDLEVLAHQEPSPKDDVQQAERTATAKAPQGRGKSVTLLRRRSPPHPAEQTKRKLEEDIDDLRAQYRGYKELLHDIKSGVIATIPFLLTDELQNEKRYKVEIDLSGIVRRVPVIEVDDDDPFAGMDDDDDDDDVHYMTRV